MIQVEHIVKDYGGRKAVDDLSFTLEKGNIYGFLGPNGAGKTTTMNIMTGYIAATTGTVTVSGHDILREAEEAKKHIGYLPELPPVYGDMTVAEYLSFVADLKKVPKNEKRDGIAKVVKMTMLGGYTGRMIRNLSKGYRQRVGLAQALIGNPEIIILDEPTVGLDPQQIIEIRNLIRSLKEDHIVVLSSHILSEVNEVCDEVIIISQGKMVAQGTPAELERTYSGEAHLHLKVIAEKDVIRQALQDLDGIADLSIADEEGVFSSREITVIMEEGTDIREQVARAFLMTGTPVIEMRMEQRTLEDVFLTVTQATPGEITRKADPAPEETAAPPEEETDPAPEDNTEGGAEA